MGKLSFTRKFKPLELLTEAQVEEIQQASLHVLSQTGLVYKDDQALSMLADHGCQVDIEQQRVRFPEALVKESLGQCLDSFEIRTRDPENPSVQIRDGKVSFMSSCGLGSVDLDTWESKQPTRKDFYDFIKVLDALPNVHCIAAFPYWGFQKVPGCMSLIESMAAKVRMSTKMLLEGSVLGNERWIVEMALATNQDVIQLVNPSAPLTFTQEASQKVISFSQNDVPAAICSGPTAGATSPVTIAGAVVTGSAEHIGGLVLANLVRPGGRWWSANMTMMQNMRTGAPYFSQAGNLLIDGAFHQVWRNFNVPSWTTMAAWTGSKAIDFQASYEMTMAATLAAMFGSTIIIFQGGLSQQQTAHPVKAVLDDDVAGMLGRILEGIEVNDETLALDVVDKVGPLPGTFLTTAHTRKWWKREQYVPQIADHLSREDWLKAGAKVALDRARERAEEILATHQPRMLPPEQEQAVEDILNDARQYYRQKGMITDDEWALYQQDINSPDYPFA